MNRFTFASATVGATSLTGLTYGNTAPTLVIKEESGKKYAEFTIVTPSANQYSNIIFNKSLVGDFGNFDYIEMDMKNWTDANGNGGSLGLGGIYWGSESGGNIINAKENAAAWKTYRFSREDSMSSVKNNGEVRISMQPWAAQTVHVCLSEIRGGYNDITVSDTAIDLTAKSGVSEGELTATFNGVEVSNKTAFVPSTSGTLELTVNKAGYRTVTYTINVVEGA